MRTVLDIVKTSVSPTSYSWHSKALKRDNEKHPLLPLRQSTTFISLKMIYEGWN